MLELKANSGGQEVVLQFEHSLLSLSKWEEKHCKPWSVSEKTAEELIDYFQDMLVTPGANPDLVYALSPENLSDLAKYINSSRTASSVPPSTSKKGGPKEIVTSELIYFWMSALKIPFHPAETWHLSRLMMLVQIADFKQQPPQKRAGVDAVADWREMNARNKAKLGSKG